MGLFSGEDKTYVSTTTSRMVEDKKFISSVKSGTIKSIFAKSSATTDYIMEDLINGLGFTAKQYYKFGRDKYPFGLPTAFGVTEFGGGQIVQDYLRDHMGLTNATVYKNFISQYNYWHKAFAYIDSLHDLNPKTGELRNQSNIVGEPVSIVEVYLTMNQATFDAMAPDSSRNRSLTYPSAAMAVNINWESPNNEIKVMLSYSWISGYTASDPGDGSVVYTPIYDGRTDILPDNIFNTGYNLTDQYFHTIYEDLPANNYGWFNYRIGAGQDEALDNVFNPAFNDVGSYFPWAYLRYNKIKGNDNPTDPAYLASKKMLKKIHIDYDDLCDKIHENPDIADVEQAMLVWAIEADSQNPLDLRYLFEYFDNTFIDSGGMAYSLDHTDLADPIKVGELFALNALIIQDARFKMGISNSGMYKRTFMGSIGPVGTYASGELDLFFEYNVTEETEGGSFTYVQRYPIPSHYYRKQVQPGWYEEILVMGLAVQYHVYGEYQVTADGDTDDTRSDILLIPLDLAVTRHFSLLKREELYSRSLYLVFNARVTVHLKWYQSTFFEFLMVVVAIAITLYTGLDAMTAFATSALTMTGIQILTAVLLTGLEYLVTSMAFKLFVKAVGVKVAFLVALIGMAVGYGIQMGDKIGANLSQNMPFAGDLLKASQGLAKAVKSEYESDMLGMKKELDAMAMDLKALGVATKTVEDEMAENSTYKMFIPLGETPEDFFNRTIHAGNIGMIGIDAVSNFVERSLSLPQPIGELV